MNRDKTDFLQDIRKKLYSMSDEKYRKFSMSLLPGIENVIGVRLPDLRKLAKDIAKSEYALFYLESDTDGIFEENMLHGMVTAYIKTDFEEKIKLIERFVPLINCWSVCDSFCTSLKPMKKLKAEQRQELFNFLKPYFLSDKEYFVRFAVVMLMVCFDDEDYLEKNFEMILKITHNGYYVKMAVAWAISVFFVTDSKLTKKYMESGCFDDDTLLKAIGKIRDSYRVSGEDKQYVFKLREKIKKARNI